MHILILNGPNLNLLGRREPDIYGHRSFEEYIETLRSHYPEIRLTCQQSNIEGRLIDILQDAAYGDSPADGVVLNAGAYTHTSIAIADCIRSLGIPVIETHISNVHSREAFRHHSMIAGACTGVIAGFGLDSYRLAIEALIERISDRREDK